MLDSLKSNLKLIDDRAKQKSEKTSFRIGLCSYSEIRTRKRNQRSSESNKFFW